MGIRESSRNVHHAHPIRIQFDWEILQMETWFGKTNTMCSVARIIDTLMRPSLKNHGHNYFLDISVFRFLVCVVHL